MPQTFYIESDEEIISVIGRLRRSSSEDNYFVFPKRALVLQSIINLRLFQREAEKIGKRIVIVTQDDLGKVLAEKAGLKTERYTDDFSRSAHVELVAPQPVAVSSIRMPQSHKEGSLRSQDIGSNDFYGGIHPSPSQNVSLPTAARTLRIRNASPLKQTSLNSRRSQEYPQQSQETSTLAAPQSSHLVASVPEKEGAITNDTVSPNDGFRQSIRTGREERLRNFFSSSASATPTQQAAPVSVPTSVPIPSETKSISVVTRKAGGIFLFLGGVSLLSLIGVAFYLFLPKAEVHVVPYKTTQNVDIQFEGRSDAAAGDGESITARILEHDEDVSFSSDATGTASGTSQKARGTLTITNAFSSEPQSLVATTRFESTDGKVFRLAEGTTVPGMKDGKPGSVEAAVIADQAGTEYNIAGTITFTIPGFKGSPKYDKFTGQSSRGMSGGGNGSSGGEKVISKSDLERAGAEAKQKAQSIFLESISKDLQPGERVLEESLDIVAQKDALLPLSGTVASSFEYKNTFKVRGFVFSEEAIKQNILSQREKTISGITFRPVSVVLTYDDVLPDFDGRSVRLKVHAVISSESVIRREDFLNEILGKNEEGINALLGSFPEVKKIEIHFKPQWFTTTVPNAAGRVTLFIEPGQE